MQAPSLTVPPSKPTSLATVMASSGAPFKGPPPSLSKAASASGVQHLGKAASVAAEDTPGRMVSTAAETGFVSAASASEVKQPKAPPPAACRSKFQRAASVPPRQRGPNVEATLVSEMTRLQDQCDLYQAELRDLHPTRQRAIQDHAEELRKLAQQYCKDKKLSQEDEVLIVRGALLFEQTRHAVLRVYEEQPVVTEAPQHTKTDLVSDAAPPSAKPRPPSLPPQAASASVIPSK